MPRSNADAIADLQAWRKKTEQRHLGMMFRIEKIEEKLRLHIKEITSIQDEMSQMADEITRLENR